jgi:ABC-2 type transport system permease protein
MAPGSIPWFARQELKLAWREWRGLMTAGGRRRIGTVIIVILLIGAALHVPAYAMLARFAADGALPDLATLIGVSVIVLLYGSLLLSQAMETVTRAFYSRADLDLILSAPVSPRKVFSVRIGANALTIALLAVLLAAPFINVLAIAGGPRWLAAYGVAAALGVAAVAAAVAITVGLFRLLGPRRTRLVAQIVAAVIGAAFAIGIQAMAILYYGALNRLAFLVSDDVTSRVPGMDSLVWWPARAILGDGAALAAVVVGGIALLLAAMAVFSGRFGEHALSATAIAPSAGRQGWRPKSFREQRPMQALRRKEWILLRRDPWLASQTLTQLLYLIPPALLLSQNFGGEAGALVVAVAAMVTVAGQLGGGLAWLAISGEDAPDLVATAPVKAGEIIRAKVEAVMGAIGVVFVPLLLLFALFSPFHALVTAIGAAVAALASIRIQLWFKSQAKRSHFRRRHTSSRLATFSEAFSSFAWAAAAGLAASLTWLAGGAALVALLILAGAWAVSPRKATA